MRDRSTKSATDRAGEQLRAILTTDDPVDREKLREAVGVAWRFRAMHEYPMTAVTVGVAYYLRKVTGSSAVRPSQRFKRLDRIISKLARYPSMRLSQMEDIGGCRAVLPSLELVYGVADAVTHRWRDARVVDYIAHPKASGYRALHIIERRYGCLNEVQLRTGRQHSWAEAVEEWGPIIGFNVKDSDAPTDVLTYFEHAAYRFALEDRGEDVDDSFRAEFDSLRERVLPYFQRRQRDG